MTDKEDTKRLHKFMQGIWIDINPNNVPDSPVLEESCRLIAEAASKQMLTETLRLKKLFEEE